jgi:molecular chaperone HscB
LINYFELFSRPVQYELDRAALERDFRSLQMAVHPDRFASATPAEQRHAAEKSMRINAGYRELKDPILRVLHICQLAGYDTDMQNNTTMPIAFLHEQMRWRESIEEILERGRSCSDSTSNIDELDRLEAQVNEARSQRLDRFADLVDVNRNLPAALQTVRELMFINKLAEQIEHAQSTLTY